MKRLLLFVITILCVVSAFGQVSGIITDSKNGKQINDCSVFINNSLVSTTTNSKGEFELVGIKPGFVDIVLYKSNYAIFKSSLRIEEGKAYIVNLTITPDEEKIKAPRVRQDEEWNRNVEWFQQAFLGSSDNASLTKITNLKSLIFQREGDQLRVRSTEPIIIENKALGYSITYHLQNFVAGVESADFQGLAKFDSLTSKDYVERSFWYRNRQKAYWGSDRHLFRSMVIGDIRAEGFELYSENGDAIQADSLATPSRIAGYTNIRLPDRTRVRYIIEEGSSGIQVHDQKGQISWITRKGSIDVTPEGVLFNSGSVDIVGNLSSRDLASAVPIDYLPNTSIQAEKVDWQNFGLLQERAYIHTDRDYYYPRETIWFKAYLGFSMPILRDTLSRLLYVEFIAPSGEILITRNVKIRDGLGWGEFVLPQKLNEGEYYIRAYTNWMRNYKEGIYFKPVPILSYDENLAPATQVSEPSGSSKYKVSITGDKDEYQPREKISLSIEVLDSQGRVVESNVSISVTDSQEAIPIPQIQRITTPGVLDVKGYESKNAFFESIEHYMERGISFAGKIVDEKGNGLDCHLDIIQGNMDNLISMETGLGGNFLVTGLDFVDSLNFAFKPINAKGKLNGTVKLLDRDRPLFNYVLPKLVLQYEADNALQRVQNTYNLDKGTILLQEVIVTDKPMEKESKTMPKLYGQPDYVVKGSDIRGVIAGVNPLIGLQGRVPGIQVTEYFDDIGMRHVRVKVRGGTSSIAGNTDPLILVDGVPWGSPDDLMSVSPTLIDHVDVITRGVAQFGSRGANGVIAVYTKRGIDPVDTPKDYLSYKIGGYSSPLTFKYPDYSKNETDVSTDFRTTLYWNPSIAISENTQTQVEFYAADLETTYRVIVEGVDTDGSPFRGESFIKVVR